MTVVLFGGSLWVVENKERQIRWLFDSEKCFQETRGKQRTEIQQQQSDPALGSKIPHFTGKRTKRHHRHKYYQVIFRILPIL